MKPKSRKFNFCNPCTCWNCFSYLFIGALRIEVPGKCDHANLIAPCVSRQQLLWLKEQPHMALLLLHTCGVGGEGRIPCFPTLPRTLLYAAKYLDSLTVIALVPCTILLWLGQNVSSVLAITGTSLCTSESVNQHCYLNATIKQHWLM